MQRDRDGVYGEVFQGRVKNLGIEEVVSAPRSPWQNPYVERLIGSVRRECLNHVIVLNEAHLRRILTEYFEYYNGSRAHQSLDRNAPVPREIEPPERGQVIAIPHLGGLHHRYTRQAASCAALRGELNPRSVLTTVRAHPENLHFRQPATMNSGIHRLAATSTTANRFLTHLAGWGFREEQVCSGVVRLVSIRSTTITVSGPRPGQNRTKLRD